MTDTISGQRAGLARSQAHALFARTMSYVAVAALFGMRLAWPLLIGAGAGRPCLAGRS
jgi:hypothetical protein